MLFKTWVHNIKNIDQDTIKKKLYLAHKPKLSMKNLKIKKNIRISNVKCNLWKEF
jgi:hypothetical protein